MTYRKSPKPQPRLIGVRPHEITPIEVTIPADTPLPAAALSLTLTTDGRMAVYLPPLPGFTKGSTVFLSCNPAGFDALHSILKERQRTPLPKFSTPGAPTRALAEALERAARNAIRDGKSITNLSPKKLSIDDFSDCDFDGDL